MASMKHSLLIADPQHVLPADRGSEHVFGYERNEISPRVSQALDGSIRNEEA